MYVIILEAVLFVALLATVAALVSALAGGTPLGVRVRQVRNRLRIEREAALTCPAHGPRDEREMVRLPSGERICPDCYREIATDA